MTNPDDACEQAEVVDVACPGGERCQRCPGVGMHGCH